MENNHPPLPNLLESNNPNLKLCSICGLEEKLTFEHIPPKASGNAKPVNIRGLENMTPAGGYLFDKFRKSPKGMGGHKLCRTCNNLTGAWYAESYIDFSTQVLAFMENNIGKDNLEFKCKIKPLNYLKQVLSILLCCDQANGILRKKIIETNFILNKKQKELSKDIYLNELLTLNPNSLMKGFTSNWDSKNGFSSNIEFIYKPLYFRAAFNVIEMIPEAFDLRNYTNYSYDEQADVVYKINLGNFIES